MHRHTGGNGPLQGAETCTFAKPCRATPILSFNRIGDQVARELARRGHPVKTVDAWSGTVGHAQTIRIHREGGFLEGGADPRGDGAALGW